MLPLVPPMKRARIRWFALTIAAAAALATLFYQVKLRPHPLHRLDPRFLTLGEAAERLARDREAFEAVLEALGAGRTAVGLVNDAERAAMRRLFEAAEFDALDAHPRTDLSTLASALKLLA